MVIERRMLLAAGAALAAPLGASAAPRTGLAAVVVGAWRLVDAVTVGETGAVTPWEGRTGPHSGLICYLAGGQMSVQIASKRASGPQGGDISSFAPAERLALFDSYYAYYGSWEVDDAASEVRHRVQSSLDPTEIGLLYRRKVRLDGNRLILSTDVDTNRKQKTYNQLTWERT